MSIRFDGKVAIVTGAGGGLGRSHALALAARGAAVVVNDLGGAVDGTGGSSQAAQAVVKEIVDAGGKAIANGASVTDRAGVDAMIQQTLNAFGRIDILINNAGVLRDKTFAKIALDDFAFVVDVHLMGAVNCTKAVWPVMVEQTYGRIVMTSSPTGLYGNFGQTNYGAAKLALIGLMNTLKLEGQKYNVRINAIAPVAATRMTEHLMPPALLELVRPEQITAGVLYLLSEDAPTGEIMVAGAGFYARAAMMESDGMALGRTPTPEAVAENWAKIRDMSVSHLHLSVTDEQHQMFGKVAEAGL